MRIVIWGYGGNGKKCYNLFRSKLKRDEIICFVDNKHEKLCDNFEIPVVTAGTLRILCNKGLVDKIIIPGYEPAIYRSICIQLYNLKIEYKKLLFYAEVEWFEEKLKYIDTMYKLVEEAEEVIPLVGALEYEVSEKCNLNCKRCNHFSNIFKNGTFADIESFKNDILAIRKLVYQIKRFKLLGGEPLMNPDLWRFIEITREVFPNTYIAIVTNGILLRQMPEILIETLKKTNTVVEISVYPPMLTYLSETEDFLEINDIQYKVFRIGDEFGAFLNETGNSDPNWAITKCYAQICHSFKNGYIYKCTTGMNIHVLNDKYQKKYPEIGIPLYKNAKLITAKKLYEYLIETVDLCRYCEEFDYFPWEATKNDAMFADWISKKSDATSKA